MKNKYIIFDLDDTLMYEIDYLESAYLRIASMLDENNSGQLFEKMITSYKDKQDTFSLLETEYTVSKHELLDIYRNHYPLLKVNEDVNFVLDYIKNKNYKLGLITDGRSVTQRNKLKALNIESLFDEIIISEEFGSTKPNENNYKVFMTDTNMDYFYIGDNPKKDFITPNKLGWQTIALKDRGRNIHQQNFDESLEHKPHFIIDNLRELINYIS
ncbi:hypothetical protein A0O34_14060 [Chryseobacterium glaciei]|uniref:HAD family hydrolase n=1 Tax=Chryseobacterium glaciei TaxID=1685010 RepID=A0A172XWZ3_9FLAO|nr:HAD family hydrolase [Chryseobacterium glaciei]ANF51559.1 hypothetical protein A0O34_14060 [Chryseobacterium glaciei]